MKKTVLFGLFMAMMGASMAQVDTFALDNMPRYFYLGNQWFDYDNYFAPSYPRHSDGTLCPVPALAYDVLFCSSSGNVGSGFWGVEMLISNQREHLPTGNLNIRNFAAGKHSDTAIRMAGVALMLPRYFDGSRVRNSLITEGFDAITLKLMDTSMNVIAEGTSLLSDSVGKPVFLFNGHFREVNPILAFTEEWTGAGVDNSYFVYYDIHEVYFDNSITVADSFYLGAYLRKILSSGKEEVGVAIPSIYEFHRELNGQNPYAPTDRITSPFNWKAQGGDHLVDFIPATTSYIFESVDDSVWFATTPGEDNYGYMLIFPILEPDCGLRGEIRWNPTGGGNVRVRWESGSNDTLWEVSYGPSGTAPEDGTVVTTTSPSALLGGIGTDTHYVAYVRALCTRYRDTVWSDWSDSISIFISTQGIVDAEGSEDIVLSSNPASATVRLTSGTPLTDIEVYTAKGAFYKRIPTTGCEAVLDVATWPRGTYLLRITTPLGPVTKKLLVQ